MRPVDVILAAPSRVRLLPLNPVKTNCSSSLAAILNSGMNPTIRKRWIVILRSIMLIAVMAN
jgi:hypothetical protein